MKATVFAVVALAAGSALGYFITRQEFAHENLPLEITRTSTSIPGKTSAASPLASGKIGPKASVVNGERHDFGTMDRHGQGQHKFVVRNDGDAPLTLHAGKTSCQCTSFAVVEGTVQPGQTTNVVLEWAPKRAEAQFEQTADLETNQPNRPTIVLTIKGRLIDMLRPERPDVHFHDLSANESATQSI